MAQKDAEISGTTRHRAPDGLMEIIRNPDGTVTIQFLSHDGGKVASRSMSAEVWKFYARVV